MDWKLEKRKLSSLKPHPKNPRKLSTHDAEHLQRSIEKYGLIDKPIVDKLGHIIGGHQRVAILKKMGMREVECWVATQDLNEKDIDELNIRLNRAQGEWDFDVLANEWEIEDLMDWGFTPEELAHAPITDIEAEEDGQTFEPGKDEDAITKLGDRLEIDSHVVMCGDSTDPNVVRSCLGDNTPVLMVTDPPYGINYKYDFYKDKKCENELLVSNVFSLVSCGKVWTPGLMNLSRELKKYPHAKVLVWNKKFAQAGSGLGGASTWEPILVIDPPEKNLKNDVIEIMTDREFLGENSLRDLHPCPKPVRLYKELVESFTKKEDCIYEPFLGSGTTLIAAAQSNRRCFGIELSPSYCDIIVKRYIKWRKNVKEDYVIIKNGVETEEYDN